MKALIDFFRNTKRRVRVAHYRYLERFHLDRIADEYQIMQQSREYIRHHQAQAELAAHEARSS